MTVIVDNTGFSIEYWSRFNEAEFIEHGMQQKVFKQYHDKDRIELLKFAYKQIAGDSPRDAKKAEGI
jgi:hypothetical protein